MRKILLSGALALLAVSAPARAVDCNGHLLDHEEKRLLGGSENLCQAYAGKVVLVVNTASRCGYTPQFESLEKLYKTRKNEGLVVLGFPSDQFRQEEATDESIAKFCTTNYGVSFPMYTKTRVDGADANPFYKALKTASGKAPGWNFNKYLISRDGKVVGHYASGVSPTDSKLQQAIEAELAKPLPAGDKTAQR